MAIHLPVEVLSLIFTNLIDDLFKTVYPFEKKSVQDTYRLLLVSRSIRSIVEPMLYRNIKHPSDRRARALCRTMNSRTELVAAVRKIDINEEDGTWGEDHFEYKDSSAGKYQRRTETHDVSKTEGSDPIAKSLKSRFENYGGRI
ncbi:hypothetical protein BDW62DRAFT_178130 [Aspergillus aurantiobrunneus]